MRLVLLEEMWGSRRNNGRSLYQFGQSILESSTFMLFGLEGMNIDEPERTNRKM